MSYLQENWKVLAILIGAVLFLVLLIGGESGRGLERGNTYTGTSLDTTQSDIYYPVAP
jgi:hypothetical protein